MKFYRHAYPNALIEGVRFNNHYAETFDAKKPAPQAQPKPRAK